MAEQIVFLRKKTVPITQQPRITGKIWRAFGFTVTLMIFLLSWLIV